MTTDAHHENQKQLFGMIFLLAQRWQVMGDRELADSGVTTKQWLLLVTMQAFFTEPPSMKALAEVMGTSRQNIKQIALNLQSKGLVAIYPDPVDKRILRFRLTARNREFWAERVDKDERYIESLFAQIPPTDLAVTCRTVEKLLALTALPTSAQKHGEEGSNGVKQTRVWVPQDAAVPETMGEDLQPDLHNRFDWADY